MCRVCAIAHRMKNLNQRNLTLFNTRSLSTLIEVERLTHNLPDLTQSFEKAADSTCVIQPK